MFQDFSSDQVNKSEVADSVNVLKWFESIVKVTLKNGFKVMCDPGYQYLTDTEINVAAE
jgi:hypothetical protein